MIKMTILSLISVILLANTAHASSFVCYSSRDYASSKYLDLSSVEKSTTTIKECPERITVKLKVQQEMYEVMSLTTVIIDGVNKDCDYVSAGKADSYLTTCKLSK